MPRSARPSRGRPLTTRLPPGFTALPCDGDPCAAAVARAVAGSDPGLVMHRELGAMCAMAVILAPDRPIADAELLALGTRAVRGALAALAPIRLPIDIVPPASVAVNGGEAAGLRVLRPESGASEIPDWLVLGVEVAVDVRQADPGLHPGRTCLREEGFDADAAGVMAAICRHLLSAFHARAEAA